MSEAKRCAYDALNGLIDYFGELVRLYEQETEGDEAERAQAHTDRMAALRGDDGHKKLGDRVSAVYRAADPAGIPFAELQERIQAVTDIAGPLFDCGLACDRMLADQLTHQLDQLINLRTHYCDGELKAAEAGLQLDTREVPLTAPPGTPSPLHEAYDAVADALFQAAQMRRQPPTNRLTFDVQARALSAAFRTAREQYHAIEGMLQAAADNANPCAFQAALDAVCRINDLCGGMRIQQSDNEVSNGVSVARVRAAWPFNVAEILRAMRRQVSKATEILNMLTTQQARAPRSADRGWWDKFANPFESQRCPTCNQPWSGDDIEGWHCSHCDTESPGNPLRAAYAHLVRWARIDVVAGKLVGDWWEMYEQCREGGMPEGEPNHWLPIIRDCWNRLMNTALTHGNLVAYFYRTRQLPPDEVAAMSLTDLARSLRSDSERQVTTRSQSEEPARPRDERKLKSDQSAVDGPTMAKALITEAVVNDGKLKDGTKLTVVSLVKKLNNAGVNETRDGLYTKKEYEEARTFGQRLGLFRDQKQKRSQKEAIKKGSKNKHTGQVETADHREQPPDQIVR